MWTWLGITAPFYAWILWAVAVTWCAAYLGLWLWALVYRFAKGHWHWSMGFGEDDIDMALALPPQEYFEWRRRYESRHGPRNALSQ